MEGIGCVGKVFVILFEGGFKFGRNGVVFE